MRGMQLERTDAELDDAIHLCAGIGDGAGEDAAEGDEPIRRCFAIVCAPVVDLGREADDIGRDVIDEAGAFDAELIEKL